MNLLHNVIGEELDNLNDQNIKLKIIGDLSPLPEKTRKA